MYLLLGWWGTGGWVVMGSPWTDWEAAGAAAARGLPAVRMGREVAARVTAAAVARGRLPAGLGVAGARAGKGLAGVVLGEGVAMDPLRDH